MCRSRHCSLLCTRFRGCGFIAVGADLTATYRQVIQVSACTVEGGRSGSSLRYMYYISFRFTDERNLQEKFNCIMICMFALQAHFKVIAIIMDPPPTVWQCKKVDLE